MKRKKSTYVFYFDETFHTKKITYKDNKLNIENDVDFYVGCYIGSYNWNQIENELIALEKEYKYKMGILDNQELKSTSLINKNKLPYGVCSLRKTTIEFYNRLFEILNNNIKIHFDVLSKYEFLLCEVLPEPIWWQQNNLNIKAFLYSFTKFIILHPQYKICDVLLREQDNRQKKRELINIFNQHLIKIKGIDKKQEERAFAQKMIQILRTTPISFKAFNKLPWDYNVSPELFNGFLDDAKLKLKHLYVDEEYYTVDAAHNLFGDKATPLNSKDSIQIRVCDWIVCLISRLILAYSKDFYNVPVEEDLSEKIYLLDEKYFLFEEQTTNFIKNMIQLFFVQQKECSIIAGGIYNGGIQEFFAFFQYCYFCFENNKTPTPQDYNKHLIALSHDYINTLNK